ncbi:MAG: zinc ribbon domain-containing protein [Clostridia bacterium]|nr:zinc ribbon domain-containing protein [Clostridia bacterium]
MSSEDSNVIMTIETEEKICDCGFINKPNAKFCSSCGTELKEKEPEIEEPQIYFCDQCGNEIAKGDIFCNKCGNRVAGDEKQESGNAVSEEKSFDVKKMIEKYDAAKRKTFVKILSIVVLVCFLMPFVKESALGFDLSMNGVETAFGTFFSESARDMADSEDIPANVFVLLSLVSCGIALLYCCQLEDLSKEIGGFHIASAVLLIIYMISYSAYYGETEWDFLVSVEHGFAVWAIILINAVAGIIAWVSASKEESTPLENQQEGQTENGMC